MGGRQRTPVWWRPAIYTRQDQIELLTSFSTGGVTEGERALARRISLGVIVGATLTPDFRGVQGSMSYISINGALATYTYSYFSGPRSFLVGPMAEIAVAKGLFVEGDAIYRPMRSGTDINGELSSNRVIGTWNLPVLGKYKFSVRRLKPLVEAGSIFSPGEQAERFVAFWRHRGNRSKLILAGLKIAPVVRYTHWGRSSLDFPGAFLPFQNQIEVLGGFFS